VVNTTAATTVDASAPGSSSGSAASSAPRITRPYHVPDDLALALFQKPDYVQFTMLRNQLLTDHLAMVPEKLTPGGNKASTLAEKLKMF
jgi:hypothetical protein